MTLLQGFPVRNSAVDIPHCGATWQHIPLHVPLRVPLHVSQQCECQQHQPVLGRVLGILVRTLAVGRSRPPVLYPDARQVLLVCEGLPSSETFSPDVPAAQADGCQRVVRPGVKMRFNSPSEASA